MQSQVTTTAVSTLINMENYPSFIRRLRMVLYQICVFGADLKSNMAARNQIKNWILKRYIVCIKSEKCFSP
jgi:hypothetical protein